MKSKLRSLFLASVSITVATTTSGFAATWVGDTDNSWATAGNWTGTQPDNVTAQAVVYDNTINVAAFTQTLDGSYTVTGITVADPAGNLTVNTGTGTNILTIGSGGIDLSAADSNLSLGSATASTGFEVLIGADQSWNVAADRTLTVGQNGGAITLSNKLTKTGVGSFALGGNGVTTLTGAGVLEINDGTFTNNMQTGSLATGRSGATTLTAGNLVISTSISMFGTGVINLNGGAIGSGTGTGRTFSNDVNIGGDVRIGGTGFSTGTMTFSGPINLGGATRQIDSGITGGQGTILSGAISSGGLTLNSTSGTGILTLSNDTNSYTGATTVTSGYLAISNNAIATSSSTSLAANTRLFVGVNGTTTINNLNGVSTSGIRSDFTITGGSGSRVLSVNQTTNGEFAGSFVTGGSRPISLIKDGAATLTISALAAYTGTTTVSAGTLAIGATNVLPATAVSIGAGTLAVGAGFTDTVGTLDPTAAATINLGTGATLAFADSEAIDWTGGTLNITGNFVSGSSLRFGDTASQPGLTVGQLSQITAPGYTGFGLDADGYLTATVSSSDYTAWKTANSTAQTIDQDHDNDGVSNGVEFFLGGPNDTTGFTAQPAITGTSVTYAKHSGYPGTYGTHFVIETSETLAGAWTPETVGGNVTQSGDNFTYTFPGGGPAKKFVRLKVTGP